MEHIYIYIVVSCACRAGVVDTESLMSVVLNLEHACVCTSPPPPSMLKPPKKASSVFFPTHPTPETVWCSLHLIYGGFATEREQKELVVSSDRRVRPARCPVGSHLSRVRGRVGYSQDRLSWILFLSPGWLLRLSSLPVCGVHLLVALGVLTNVSRKSASDAQLS